MRKHSLSRMRRRAFLEESGGASDVSDPLVFHSPDQPGPIPPSQCTRETSSRPEMSFGGTGTTGRQPTHTAQLGSAYGITTPAFRWSPRFDNMGTNGMPGFHSSFTCDTSCRVGIGGAFIGCIREGVAIDEDQHPTHPQIPTTTTRSLFVSKCALLPTGYPPFMAYSVKTQPYLSLLWALRPWQSNNKLTDGGSARR